MLYDNNLKEAMLDALTHRVSGVADCIYVLFSQGYIPNKNKTTILTWSSILIDAFENIDVLSKEQQTNLESIYNKVISL